MNRTCAQLRSSISSEFSRQGFRSHDHVSHLSLPLLSKVFLRRSTRESSKRDVIRAAEDERDTRSQGTAFEPRLCASWRRGARSTAPTTPYRVANGINPTTRRIAAAATTLPSPPPPPLSPPHHHLHHRYPVTTPLPSPPTPTAHRRLASTDSGPHLAAACSLVHPLVSSSPEPTFVVLVLCISLLSSPDSEARSLRIRRRSLPRVRVRLVKFLLFFSRDHSLSWFFFFNIAMRCVYLNRTSRRLFRDVVEIRWNPWWQLLSQKFVISLIFKSPLL